MSRTVPKLSHSGITPTRSTHGHPVKRAEAADLPCRSDRMPHRIRLWCQTTFREGKSMRRLAVLAIPIVAVCVLFAAPMASAQDTGSAQVARASSLVAPASTPKCWPGPNIGMYCHDDLTEWVPAIGHWAAPVFCAKKEDW